MLLDNCSKTLKSLSPLRDWAHSQSGKNLLTLLITLLVLTPLTVALIGQIDSASRSTDATQMDLTKLLSLPLLR